MKALDQLLRVYQRTVAAAVLAAGYWLILLFAIADELQLGLDVIRTGILTMGIGSAVVLNWMGRIDAVLLYTRSGKRRRYPGKFWLCLRAVLHAYGSLALHMLSWRIFGYFTNSFIQIRHLLLISRLHLVFLVPLYCYVEDGEWPRRWRWEFFKSVMLRARIDQITIGGNIIF